MSSNVTSASSRGAAETYIRMIDNSTPATIARTCESAAEQARRDASVKAEDAKKLRFEAGTFAGVAGADMQAEANKLFAEAAKAEQDARNRLAWAGRLDEMARDAAAKLAS